MSIELKASGTERVEIKRRNEPGSVRFSRQPNGRILVVGDASGADIAKCIRRAKAKRGEKRAPLGATRAAAYRKRMRARLARAGA